MRPNDRREVELPGLRATARPRFFGPAAARFEPETVSDAGTVAPAIFDRSGVTLALAMGLVYGATRATALTPDSLVYATAIRDGTQLLHPHHLLFAPIVHAMRIATGLDAVTAAQVHNILWAIVAVLAVRHLFSILLASRGAATWCAAALATAAGFAGFATQVEVYVPSLACTSMALALMVGHGTQRARAARIAAAGLALAMAILYAQGAVLVVIALLFLPVASPTRAQGGAVRAAVVGIAGVATFAVYLVAYATTREDGGYGGFLRFCLHYAVDRSGWGTFDNLDAKGLHLLADSQLRSLVHLPGEEFAIHGYVGSAVFTAAMACVACRLLWLSLRDPSSRAAVRFLAAWAIVPLAFTLWWVPREEEYLVATIPPVVAAIAMAMIARPARSSADPSRVIGRAEPPRVAWLALAAIATWNFGALILPRFQDAGADALVAADLARAADDRTIVLCNYPVFGNYVFRERVGRPVVVDQLFLALYANRGATGIAIDTATRVVPLALIEPQSATWGSSALTDRDGWLRVIGWVCCLDRGEAGTTPSYATLSCVDAPSGPLLRVDPEVRRTGDLADVLAELDRLDPRQKARFKSFSR